MWGINVCSISFYFYFKHPVCIYYIFVLFCLAITYVISFYLLIYSVVSFLCLYVFMWTVISLQLVHCFTCLFFNAPRADCLFDLLRYINKIIIIIIIIIIISSEARWYKICRLMVSPKGRRPYKTLVWAQSWQKLGGKYWFWPSVCSKTIPVSIGRLAWPL